MSRRHRPVARALIGAILPIALAGAMPADTPGVEGLVEMMGRRFASEAVRLRAGGRVTVVNNEGELIHHRFIDAPDLAYDSGDIEPGARAAIAFPRAGDFRVLCGIHPRMRLAVHVE